MPLAKFKFQWKVSSHRVYVAEDSKTAYHESEDSKCDSMCRKPPYLQLAGWFYGKFHLQIKVFIVCYNSQFPWLYTVRISQCCPNLRNFTVWCAQQSQHSSCDCWSYSRQLFARNQEHYRQFNVNNSVNFIINDVLLVLSRVYIVHAW